MLPQPVPVAPLIDELETAPESPSITFAPQGEPLTYWKESADTLDHVTLSVSGGYDVLVSGPQIEGTGAFHLAHPDPVPQIIQLDPLFAVAPSSRLFFESRLGWATATQVARVEVSVSGGAWTELWDRPGTGDAGQGSFERVEIPLGEVYAGETLRVRFVYAVSGSRYPQTETYVGWLIDDIQFGNSYVVDPVVYSIGAPTGLEQQNLEFINRARASASAEALRLRDTDDPDVVNAVNYFNVDFDIMIEQFDELDETLPPLAFNAALIAAARLHSQDMLEHAFQGHVSSADPPFPHEPYDGVGDRLSRQGYDFSTAGENVYAYAKRSWHAHAGFNIDWGSGAEGSIGGMQNPPGHRLAIHNPNFREIGIGIVEGSNDPVGPMLVTQNFGTRQSMNQPFITGVAWDDLNGNGEYDPGEGLGGISVAVDGERFMAITSASGGYAIPVPGDGSYTVRFQSNDHPDWETTVHVAEGNNVKVDYLRDTIPFFPDMTTFSSHDSIPGGFSIAVTNAFSVPVLQYSGDLKSWTDLPAVEPIPSGTSEYLLEVPAPTNLPVFYRLVFP